MKIPEFISDIQCKVAKLTGGNVTSVKLRAIEGSIERLKQIDEQLNVQKYRLVFIGEPGSGKTTTICNFLKLTIDAEVGDQFDRVELFETAQGRTTAAEVHFQRADRTAMVVYPMDISQQKAIAKEYCSYIWNEVFPNENEGDDQDANEDNTPDTSIEIETIICNMLGYESEDDFLDYVLEEYSDDGLDDFINETLDKLSINSQIPIEFTYDGSDDVKKWLQSTFTGINKGSGKAACIPKRVDVLLNSEDIDFFMPDYISEVIDTRGYDGNAREDLRDYFSEADTICVILDGVTALPGSVQTKILSEWVDEEEYDLINRLSLLINVHEHELARVSGANGDPEKGKKKKN